MNKFFIFTSILVLCVSCGNTPNGTANKTDVTRLSFSDVTAASGIDFKYSAGYTKDKWLPEVLAAGVVVADFNRDGAPDILFTNGGKFDSDVRPAEAANRLYINDGKGKFNDKSAEWGVTGPGYGQGAAVGDFDNDGFDDLFLTNVQGNNRLLRNTGAKFEDVTEAAGITADGKWATSAGFGDFDNDGDLDIFVVKYVEYSKSTHQKTYKNKLMRYSAPFLYTSVEDQIWRNEGEGKFTDASKESGIASVAGKGLALAIGDIDKDGDVDVYVANDTTPNQLWINDGKGNFEDIARLSGCAYSEVGKEEGSMGADFTDFDNNGLLDIIVTNFQEESTALYSQTKPLLFVEVSDAVGIGQTARARLSFGIEFFDADNDGDEDILTANGHIDDIIEENSDSITFRQQNTLYENLGNGKFSDVSDAAGEPLKALQVSRGLAVADFDSDGDLDFVVANNDGAAQLAFNESKDIGKFVGILLEGTPSNRDAIGARLVAKIGGKSIERQIMGAQSYLSVSEFRVLFGLGTATRIDSLEVFWPGGSQQTLQNIESGKYYLLKQGQSLSPLEIKR